MRTASVCSLFGLGLLFASAPAIAQDSATADVQQPDEQKANEQQIEGIGRVTLVGAVDSDRGFLEGPAAAPDGSLYYTDIPNSTILRLMPDGEVQTFTENSNHSNGLMFNAAGELVACEMDGQIAAWNVGDGSRRVLASAYEGNRFNAPNDLVIDAAGGVYFTDPRFRAPQPLPQSRQGVYYVSAEGEVTRVVPDLPAPNGVLLSLDEKTLYVFPSDAPSMRAYDVDSPGKLSAGRELCVLTNENGSPLRGGADGATIDSSGNLYVTCRLGVQVISPRGEKLGLINVPENPANVTFVGSRLYVTARTSLYAFETEVEGHTYAAPE